MNSYGTIQINLSKLMKEKLVFKNELSRQAQLSFHQIARCCKHEIRRLDMDVLARMCAVLDCKIGELLEYIPCRQDNP